MLVTDVRRVRLHFVFVMHKLRTAGNVGKRCKKGKIAEGVAHALGKALTSWKKALLIFHIPNLSWSFQMKALLPLFPNSFYSRHCFLTFVTLV
jgi:hypothetical protein